MNSLLKKQYPDAEIGNDRCNNLKINDDVTMWIALDCSEYCAWDSKGSDYSSQLKAIVDEVVAKNVDAKRLMRILLIAQQFRDSLSHGKIAGFDTANDDSADDGDISAFPRYCPETDPIWLKMSQQHSVNVNRPLLVYTYGTAFLFEAPSNSQQIFNAAILRGSSASSSQDKRSFTRKMLQKLRGTDDIIQQEVRGAALFENFLSEIVKEIETKNLTTISIICRAGHHRSVAIAEMLIYLYPHRVVEHLTIQQH